MRNDPLADILAEIGREHRTTEAPRHLAARLREEERPSIADSPSWRLQPRWAWGVGLTIVALTICGAIAWQTQRGHQPHNRQNQKVRSIPDSAPVPAPQHVRTAQLYGKARTQQTAVRDKIRKATKKESQADVTEETLADFIPLPASEGLPPVSEVSVVRVQMQRSDLRQYGFEVPAELAPMIMQAEFVVGEDGLPRAIRIIR